MKPALRLQPATLEAARCDLEDPLGFARAVGAEVPPSWPPEFYDDAAKRWTLEALARSAGGLSTFYFLLKRGAEPPLLIGCGGFKGSPKNGVTEIGYSLVPEWQGRGIGTDVVAALSARAFADAAVRAVCAHTLPELIASQRVLEKNGFARRGAPQESGTLRYELTRAEWRAP